VLVAGDLIEQQFSSVWMDQTMCRARPEHRFKWTLSFLPVYSIAQYDEAVNDRLDLGLQHGLYEDGAGRILHSTPSGSDGSFLAKHNN
jgi:hypothetical protein